MEKKIATWNLTHCEFIKIWISDINPNTVFILNMHSCEDEGNRGTKYCSLPYYQEEAEMGGRWVTEKVVYW